MTLLEETKQLCNLYNIKPVRSRGQNFLIKEDVYNTIIESADLQPDDVVVEVGPGLGFLTTKLATKVKKVIAIELDDRLAEVLKARLQDQNVDNIEVINKNVLDMESEMPTTNYKIVANLPYNITAVFLRKFLGENKHKPELMVLILQTEVVDRIIAAPGQMSILSVSTQMYAEMTKVIDVSRISFQPAPKVDSAVLKLQVKAEQPKVDEDKFFRLVKIGFSAKRKQLQKNLSAGLHIEQDMIREVLTRININEKARAQELSLQNWQELLIALDSRNVL